MKKIIILVLSLFITFSIYSNDENEKKINVKKLVKKAVNYFKPKNLSNTLLRIELDDSLDNITNIIAYIKSKNTFRVDIKSYTVNMSFVNTKVKKFVRVKKPVEIGFEIDFKKKIAELIEAQFKDYTKNKSVTISKVIDKIFENSEYRLGEEDGYHAVYFKFKSKDSKGKDLNFNLTLLIDKDSNKLIKAVYKNPKIEDKKITLVFNHRKVRIKRKLFKVDPDVKLIPLSKEMMEQFKMQMNMMQSTFKNREGMQNQKPNPLQIPR